MKHYDVARNTLLASLKNNRISYHIIILYSGENQDKVYIDHDNKITTVTMQRNLYEYGGFLVPLMLPYINEEDSFLLLHDTCIVHTGFPAKASELFYIFDTTKTDILWCSPRGQCNICIFNKKCSVVASSLWKDFNSFDKMLAIDMEHNHNNALSLKSKKELNQMFSQHPNYITGSSSLYGKHIRQRLYYSALDLDKFYIHINHSHEHPQEP